MVGQMAGKDTQAQANVNAVSQSKKQWETALISVVVPVYKVEPYLDKCVSSIVSQTYRNLEVILVDDGSPDRCSVLCDAWKTKDSRIRIIHQQHAGLSQARNSGLAIASGEYIGFVDSDDWIEPKMYERLLQVLQESGADISICNYQDEPERNIQTASVIGTDARREFTPEDAIRNTFLNTRGFVEVWNKLYRKRILENLLFPIGRIFEDVYWTHLAMARATKIVYLDTIFYHYNQRPGSITQIHQKFTQVHHQFISIDLVEAKKARLEFSRQYFPSLEALSLYSYLTTCSSIFVQLCTTHRNIDPNGSFKRDLRQRFHRKIWHHAIWQYPLKMKVHFLLFRFCPIVLVCIAPLYMKLKHRNDSASLLPGQKYNSFEQGPRRL